MSDGPKKGVDTGIIEDEKATQQTASTEERKAVEDLAQSGAKLIDGKLSMRVQVYSPFRDYFDGPAFSISAENETGPFDILPHHHNFISLLPACEVVIRSVNGEESKILIGGGLMHVKADRVVIFLDV